MALGASLAPYPMRPTLGTCGGRRWARVDVLHDCRVPLLCDPVPVGEAARLRRLVLAFTASESRRVFAPLLHVGDPDGARRSFAVRGHGHLDAALRTEVVAALLEGDPAPAPLVWLTRVGPLTPCDLDTEWLSAAAAAYAEAETPLTFVLVTRSQWLDPRSGTGQAWKRLRQR